MDIRTQSALLAAIIGMALGLSMLLRAERPRAFTLYSIFALTTGGFYLAQFAHALAGESNFYWARISLGGTLILGALVPSTALAFFLEFLGVSHEAARNGMRVALASGFFGLVVAVTPLATNFWAQFAFSAWVFGALSVSISLLFRRMRWSDSPIERLRLMYLAWGAAACCVFSITDFLPGLGIPFPTLGPVISTLFLFLLAQTLLRLRLMDLHELVGKVASQAALAAILAVVFALITGWARNDFSLFLFNAIIATFVIMILQDPLRPKVEQRIIALFFRERFQLLGALSTLRPRLTNVIEVAEVTRLVLDALNETRRVTHASVYLLADDRPGYRLLDSRGPQPVPFIDAGGARGILHAAASGQKALLLENLERRIGELKLQTVEGKRVRDELKRTTDTRTALSQMKAGICVPLVGNDRVIGFLNLWDERVPEAYASDEIALILEIAESLATVVENSKLYDKMRERDRLAALGEMAAGLAHEIRNPLGAIKGAAQCLDPKRLPGEEGEFLEVIVEEVNRLNGVVTAFLDYARPLKQSFGPTDINEVVTRTIRLIQNDIPTHIELKVELEPAALRVDGDAEQLKQVLINLVQNSIQAMGVVAGRILVRTHKPERFGEFRGAETVEVHVSDSGPGIPLDQQEHIFVPFFTTKQKGTGLGLAICQRIIKNHGGTISVQSKMSEGSTFVVRLPLLPSPPEALPALAAPQGVAADASKAGQVSPGRKERRRRRSSSA